MCYTGKCPHEDCRGECTIDWDSAKWVDDCYLQNDAERRESESITYPLIKPKWLTATNPAECEVCDLAAGAPDPKTRCQEQQERL